MAFRLESNVNAANAEIRRRASLLVRKTALQIEQAAKISMSGPKSGRFYGRHQASAPSESPAIDTGALVNSIQVEQVGETTAIVGSALEYAPHLEYGTVKMAARPWLGPAFEAQRDKFLAGLKAILK